jgi:hypothetical protein
MAITATGDNPIVVTGTTAASDDIKSSGNWVISKLYWLQPTTQAHKLALQDGNGRELFEFYCQTANSSQAFDFPNGLSAQNGIYSDDMDSGTLYIYIQ